MNASTSAPEQRESVESPEHRALASLGLLSFLDSAIGHDEYAEAQRTLDAGRAPRGPWWRLVATAAITALALVAASQTAANSTADGQQRSNLIKQITERKATMDGLTASIKETQAQIKELDSGLTGNAQLSSSVREQLALWGTQSGVLAVTGPGVEVVVDNAPASTEGNGVVQDRDLQQLANGLWQAGAEAISINGQRLTGLSAIRTAGSAITVNYQPLTPPYVIDAIGNPASMPASFAQTTSGAAWLDLQQQLGMVFSMTTKSSLSLAAAPLPTLREARPSQQKTGSAR